MKITFTRQDDGSITADDFPPAIIVTVEFLRHVAPGGFIKRRFRKLWFSTANGQAGYRMVRRGPHPGTLYCERQR